jgi:transcriptional regulator with XRE-family HTH domain
MALRAQDWAEPNADEVRAALKMANWSGEELSRRIGVDSRTLRRWTLGEKLLPIQPAAVRALAVLGRDSRGRKPIWTYHGKKLGTGANRRC